MIKYIIKLCRVAAKTPLFLYLRTLFDFYPPAINVKYSEVCSDLFIWRDVSSWDTYFNITHLGPILNPHFIKEYDAIIEVYNSHGNAVGRKKINLVFGESYLLYINDLLVDCKEKHTDGTFAVFHLVDLKELLDNMRVCVMERGFVSDQRKADISKLRSYTHANIHAVGFCLRKNQSRLLGVAQKTKKYYRQQLDLVDSFSSEIILINFLSSDALVGVYQYKENLRVNLAEIIIPPGGLTLLKSTSDFDPQFPIELESNMNFLRPVIFKYYKNHFDVLHG